MMNFPTIYELAAFPLLFAQEVEPTGGGGGEEAAANDGGVFGGLWFPMIIICVVWMFVMMIPRNDPKKHQKELLESLKKNDRVITAGGIFGTIASVGKDDPFVMLRVDDSTNARIKILKTSISRIITGEKKSEVGAGDPEGSSELKTV